MADLTPMIKQYLSIKEQYKDSILFFRMGDFYEMFFEDAEIASKILGITLTSRNKGDKNAIPLCGIPYHSAKQYVNKLINAGKKVAICEQVEDPKKAKGLVKRDVIKVVTPGVISEIEDLDSKSNNYLAAVYGDKNGFGLSFIDVSTGDFRFTEVGSTELLISELNRVSPKEIITHDELKHIFAKESNETLINYNSKDDFNFKKSYARLTSQFETTNLKGFGCEDAREGICASGVILNYIDETQKNSLSHIDRIVPYSVEKYMKLDADTRRNLEIVETMTGVRGGKNTLYHILDETKTPMGARNLVNWLLFPLNDKKLILERVDSIAQLVKDYSKRENIRESLADIYDLERINGKISIGNVNPRDLIALAESLKKIPAIKKQVSEFKSKLFSEILENLDEMSHIQNLIDKAITENPGMNIKEGGIIRQGYNEELDEIVSIVNDSRAYLANLEKEERKRTKISSLKVKFNKVFGYYIEITKANLDLAPENYIRKQTLVGGERFITPELKEFETKILNAKERREELEYKLFLEIRETILKDVKRIKTISEALAKLDTLCPLAYVSEKNNYCRPQITDNGELNIKAGRHPVLEKILANERFIPNDTNLDNKENQILIITGPNMAGKSTVMRQVALIVLMAHIGCFVPAEEAKISIVDRIFTRVGASDNIASGESTFMVEMNEVAKILNQATEKSLIIMDEVGRGTSTFDGMSIAWAVCEDIHDRVCAKTLFATHYHEITDIAKTKERIKNYNIAVKEWNEKIIFLRKLSEGSVNRSYGIQVARLAGVPQEVISRAKEVLSNLESAELNEIGMPKLAEKKGAKNAGQLALNFGPNQKEEIVLKDIKETNLDNLTPLDALQKLADLKDKLS